MSTLSKLKQYVLKLLGNQNLNSILMLFKMYGAVNRKFIKINIC